MDRPDRLLREEEARNRGLFRFSQDPGRGQLDGRARRDSLGGELDVSRWTNLIDELLSVVSGQSGDGVGPGWRLRGAPRKLRSLYK